MKIFALCVAQALIAHNIAFAVTDIQGVDNEQIFAQEFSTSNSGKHPHSNLRSEKLSDLLSTKIGTDHESKKKKKMDEETYVKFYTDYSMKQLREQEEKDDIPYKLTREQVEEKIRTIYRSQSDSDGEDSHAKGDLSMVLEYAHKHITQTPKSLDALALKTFKKMFKESGVEGENMNDEQIHQITKHCHDFDAHWFSCRVNPDELCPFIEKMFPLKYKTFPSKVKASQILMSTFMVEYMIPISGESECQKFMEEVQVRVEIIHGDRATFPGLVKLPGFKKTYEALCEEKESDNVCSKRLKKITSLSVKLMEQHDIKKYPAYIDSMCDALGFHLPHPDETIELRASAGLSTTPKKGVKNARHLVSDLFLLAQHHKHGSYGDTFGAYIQTNATASEFGDSKKLACEGKAESVSASISADLFVTSIGAAYEYGYGYEPSKPDKCKNCDDSTRSDFESCNGECKPEGYPVKDGSTLCADLSQNDEVCAKGWKYGDVYYDTVHTGGVCARGQFIGNPGAGISASFGAGFYDKVSSVPGWLRTAYIGFTAFFFTLDISIFFCCPDEKTWGSRLATGCDYCGWSIEVGLTIPDPSSALSAEIGTMFCYSWSFHPDNTKVIPYSWQDCPDRVLIVTVQLEKVPSSVKTTFQYKRKNNGSWTNLKKHDDTNMLNGKEELIEYIHGESFISDLKLCLTPDGSAQDLFMAKVGMVRIEEDGWLYDEDLVLWEENIPEFRVKSSDQTFCCEFNFYQKDGPARCYTNGHDITSWWSSFDKKGWSKVSRGYMTGMWRNSGSGGIYLIEEVSSDDVANGKYLYEHDKRCEKADWWSSFDRKGWSMCKQGYFLTSLWRNEGNNIGHIEEANCCWDHNLEKVWTNCYDLEPVLNKKGWSSCKNEHYIVGFHRKSCENVDCIDKFRCCKMGTRKPKKNQHQNHYPLCFTEDALVTMVDRTLIPISEIKTGDLVNTGMGDVGKVTNVLKHPVGEEVEVIVVNTDGGIELVGTPSHPIYINEEWMELAESVEKGLLTSTRKETRFVDYFYNLEIDGHIPGQSSHSFVAHGITVSGLGDNELLNKMHQRQKEWK